MTIDDVIKLIDAAAKLVGALAWPALVGILFLWFRPALSGLFDNLGELSLELAGGKVHFKRRQADAAAALAAATVAKAEPGTAPRNVAQEVHQAEQLVAREVTPAILRRASSAVVLWVDDRPENNEYERAALDELGVSFVLATSTDAALDKLQTRRFDAIISDMARPPDRTAGYALLEAVRQSGSAIPFIIYSSSSAPEHKAEARRRGAQGSASRPSELFEYVLAALRSPVRRGG